MAQTAPQFDWESARPVDEEPQPTAAASPAPDDTYPGAPLADKQVAAPVSPALFDWESARPVESAQDFDLESAQPLSELAKDPAYLMSRQQYRALKQDERENDTAVADFLAGIPSVVPGLINIGSGTVGEAAQQVAQNWYRPDKLLAAFTANVNEGARQTTLNYSKLVDYVYRNVRDFDTRMRREEAYGQQVQERLKSEGRLTGNGLQDAQLVMDEVAAARQRGEIPVTDEQRDQDEETSYQDYVRGKAFDQSIANITQISVSGAPATLPDSRFVGRNIVTGETVLPGQYSPQAASLLVDPVNLLSFGAGSLARVAPLRRAGILIGKGLGPVGRGLSEAGGAIGRRAEAIEGSIYRTTGIAPQAQPYVLGAAATTVGYATGGDTPFDQALTGTLALLPTMRALGGTLNKAGAAANAGWIISREASAGAMGAANAEAAAKVASGAIPERYARFVRNEGRAAADSTLRRVAQDQANPRLLRALAQFGDNVGVTSTVRAADDVIGGSLAGGAVASPFALGADTPEQAGAVIGGGMIFGGLGGVVGGKMTRMAEMQDAMVARMLVDSQASGGNAEAFARAYSHGDLAYMAGMQAFSRGKLKFVPLTTSEYRVNLDTKRRGGENTAGFHVEAAADGTQKVLINVGEPSGVAGEVVKIRQATKGGKTIEVRDKDGKSTFTYVPNASKILVKQGDVVGVGSPLTKNTSATLSVPEEIGHAIFSSPVMDGLPRDEMRNYVNQRYKTEGVAQRGREYVSRIVDQEIAAGTHGAADAIDDAARDRLVEERFTEMSRASIEAGEDPLDWARDEIIGASVRAATQGIDLNRLRNQSNFSRLAEQMVASSAQMLRVFGVDVDKMGRVVDPASIFRDNPVFADPAMRRMVTKYMRDYDQWLAGMEQAGRKDRRGVRVAPSGRAEDMANSQHTVLREVKDANGNGTGVFENDVITRGPDGVVRPKKQSDIDRTEVARSAQIKSLWDASKTVPTASTEFGKRRVNGRDVVGGPTLPPQWDLFTQFPQWIREFARQLEAGRTEGRTWIADYNAIGTGASGRYRVTNLGNIEAILREVGFVGWQITKKNHLLATVFDMNAFRAAAKRAIDNGELGEMGNNMDEVNATLLQYLDNHKNGRPGETGIGQTKKNILNGLIGTGTAKQSAANPFYAELNPRGSVRTFRVDRLNDLRDTGRTGYNFMYEPINANMMPDAVRSERADIPLNPRARQAAFISDRGEMRATGRPTHFETNADLGPDFLAIGAGHIGEDGFFRFGSESMDNAFGDSPADSYTSAARHNQALYDGGKRPSAMLEEPPGLERPEVRGQAMPDVDADYMAAVERGNMKAAQKMVDDAAERSGFNIKAFHGTPEGGFTQFKETDGGLFFSSRESVARGYTYFRNPWLSPSERGQVYRAQLRMENPLKFDAGGARHNNIPFPGREYKRTVFGNIPEDAVSVEDAAKLAFAAGHDGVIIENVMDGVSMDNKTRSTVYAIKSPDQAQITDPIARDSAGNIIPPSKRFATGRTRGQAMPDVGSFDETAGGFVVDAGDAVSLPVHQQAVRGKPAVDAAGKPKYIQRGYELLDAPGIKEYSGPGPEDTTKPDYKSFAYDTTLKGQKAINDAIDSGAVDNAANRVVTFTQEAMKNPEIAAGMGWYSRMRKYLLDALGEDGRELLSQLLGATSAKTPVEQNFLQAMDALEGINAGRYESNRKSYLEMLAAEEGNNLTAVIVERGYVSQVRKMADDLSKLSRSLKGEKKKAALAEAAKLRALAKTPASKWTKKDRFSIMINATGMMPMRSNGKKFNANSMAVLKVIAGTWLDNRNSPKTPNFAGNLSGRTVQATIDVWAARLLRQTLYEGSEGPWRIQPRSETGVNNQDFALGQIIMQRAAKKLNMNPDDLQAVLWFAEKHRWDEKGWTKNQGAEKSSFDEVFKVFFPKGKKPLTFAEASKIFEEKE